MLRELIPATFLILLVNCTPLTPKWSETYTIKGTLYSFYNDQIVEPFQAWYDGAGKRSRIDYYNGIDKTYQFSNFTTYGSYFNIVPITTETVKNQITCFRVDGTANLTVGTQTVLPALDDFEFAGNETFHGLSVEKWKFVQRIEQKTNTYTMWVYYKTDPKNSLNEIPVPIRYEAKGICDLIEHFDQYYMIYDPNSYNTETIDNSVFNIGQSCRNYSSTQTDNNTKYFATMNPMSEFIHPVVDEHIHKEFDKFKYKHGKKYSNDYEHFFRKEVFRQNFRFIHSMNRKGLNYSLAVNHLADRTDLERRALRGRIPSREYNGALPFPYRYIDTELLPESLDWRLRGAVTRVKDQSICGSCWTFSTTGTLEGSYFLKTGKLVSFSEQAMIDCTWGFGNNGCEGGGDYLVYPWMLKHGGMPTDESYGPYLAREGFCHAENATLLAQISGYVNVTPGDENAVKLALVNHGPLSTGIDASQASFTFYSNGIYHEPKCGNKWNDLDHAVLLVGYGNLDGEPYWLIKNSYTNLWGIDGYMLVSTKDNICGVATAATYVILK